MIQVIRFIHNSTIDYYMNWTCQRLTRWATNTGSWRIFINTIRMHAYVIKIS